MSQTASFDNITSDAFAPVSTIAAPAVQRPVMTAVFTEVTKDTGSALVAQLAGKDRVHVFGAESEQSLLSYRLGGRAQTKTCFAMVEDSVIYAAIYVQKDVHPIARPRDLNGNVGKILASRVDLLSSPPSSMIFYSISTVTEKKGMGMGQMLVRNLHKHLTTEFSGVALSTLSPLRSLDAAIGPEKMTSFQALPDTEKRIRIAGYLMDVQDPVQKFHMGNGAIIGDIKLDADTVGTSRAMVNYIYDADPGILAANAARFQARDLSRLVSPQLREEIGPAPAFMPA